MNDIDIGSKIKEQRIKKGLSLRELAEKTNLTASLISQIERNLSNPSINTVKTISAALDTPIYDFFLNTPIANDMVVRSDNRKKLMFPKNMNVAYELLTPDTSGSIEFLLITLEPGTSSSEVLLGHEAEEVAFVTEGTVMFYNNKEAIELSKGDSIRVMPFDQHRWVNLSNKKAEVIFAITPPTF